MTGQVFLFGSFTEEETVYFQSQPLAGAHKLAWAKDRSFPSPAHLNGEAPCAPQPPTPPIHQHPHPEGRGAASSPASRPVPAEARDAPDSVGWATDASSSASASLSGEGGAPSQPPTHNKWSDTNGVVPGARGGAAAFGPAAHGAQQQTGVRPFWPGPPAFPGHGHPPVLAAAVPLHMGPGPGAQAVGVPLSSGAVPVGIPLSAGFHAATVGTPVRAPSPAWPPPPAGAPQVLSIARGFQGPGPLAATVADGAPAQLIRPTSAWGPPRPWGPRAAAGPLPLAGAGGGAEGPSGAQPLADPRAGPFPSPSPTWLTPSSSTANPHSDAPPLAAAARDAAAPAGAFSALPHPPSPPSAQEAAASLGAGQPSARPSPPPPPVPAAHEMSQEASLASEEPFDGADRSAPSPGGWAEAAAAAPDLSTERPLPSAGCEPGVVDPARTGYGAKPNKDSRPPPLPSSHKDGKPALTPLPESTVGPSAAPPHPPSAAAAARVAAPQADSLPVPSAAAAAALPASRAEAEGAAEAAPAAVQGSGPEKPPAREDAGAAVAGTREGAGAAEPPAAASDALAASRAPKSAVAPGAGGASAAPPRAWSMPRSWAALVDKQPDAAATSQLRGVPPPPQQQHSKAPPASSLPAGGGDARASAPAASPLESPHVSRSSSTSSSTSSAGWIGVARGAHKGGSGAPPAAGAGGGGGGGPADLSGDKWQRSLREAEEPGRGFLPRGLVNTGNLCFLNSTLQALLACSPFRHLLAALSQRQLPQAGYPTLRAFAQFAEEFESAPASLLPARANGELSGPPSVIDVGRPFAPSMFDGVLSQFSPNQRPGARHRQEDAQEFLSFVMERMHTELIQLDGRDSEGAAISLPDGSLPAPVPGSDVDEEWETVGPKNRSAVTRTHTLVDSALSDIFGGQLRSVVKTAGNKASATVQPFMLLQLDIMPDHVHTVDDALQAFAASEPLDGYKAKPGRAEVVSASKAVKVQALPRVLILHLMRFSFGANGTGKVHKPVRFPAVLTPGRDLLTSPSAASEARRYELVASVSHHGKDPSGGHYTADARQPNGTWLRFDDNFVSAVPASKVFHDQAYLLLYKRVAS